MTDDKTPDGDGKGLGPKRRRAQADRPARPSARACKPVQRPPREEFARLDITRHRDLVGHQREIFRRLEANPDVAVMMAVNPVLALGELGVSFNGEMRDHVLRSIQHTPRQTERRKTLEAELEEALGEPARPNDPTWVANALFDKLELCPLVTGGCQPEYRPAANAAMTERLSKRRAGATWKKGNEKATRPRRASRIRLREWRPAVRRMDLDAPLPALERAGKPPGKVSLGTLYFYKDSHPLARKLLELGIIQQQSFPIHSGASYRDIRDGRKPNAFRAWIRTIRFGRDG